LTEFVPEFFILTCEQQPAGTSKNRLVKTLSKFPAVEEVEIIVVLATGSPFTAIAN
jgi:hypothetical protein